MLSFCQIKTSNAETYPTNQDMMHKRDGSGYLDGVAFSSSPYTVSNPHIGTLRRTPQMTQPKSAFRKPDTVDLHTSIFQIKCDLKQNI